MTESSLELKFFKSKDEALILYPKLQGSCQKKRGRGEKFSNVSGLVPMVLEVLSSFKILKHHAS